MSEISQLQINDNTYDIVDATARAGLFPGLIQMFAGSTLPIGWLLCDGSAVSRTTYAKLFAAIGTAWGTGDGSTTFNLPDLRGRAPIGAGTGSGLTARTLGGKTGAETVTLTTSQIPEHTHTYAKPNTPTGSTTLTTSQIPEHTHTYAKPDSPTGSTTVTAKTTTETEKNLPTHLTAWNNRLDTYFSNVNNRLVTLGAAGPSLPNSYDSAGTVDAILSLNAHTHTIGTTSTASGKTGGGTGHTHTIGTTSTASGSTGGGSAHNNMQPSAVVNFIIYAG